MATKQNDRSSAGREANILLDRTNDDIYRAKQDRQPARESYHSLMEKIDKIREGFAQRLFTLRSAKGVSAREMSLSLGQGAGYVNNLENGHNLPSMEQFFAMCGYLGVTPGQFFSFDSSDAALDAELAVMMRALGPDDARMVAQLVRRLSKKEA